MLFLIIIITFLSFSNLSEETGKNLGAYLKTPDSTKLQFRLGNGIGYYGQGWNESKLSYLSKLAGYDGQKKRLMEFHLDNWGYDVEIEDCKKNKEYGISDVIGYLGYPIKSHSSNITANPEFCYPDNLYDPIWLEDGSINSNNYWAYYVYNTVNKYKDYIKIWEAWEEPDYTTNFENIEKWSINQPKKTDLTHWFGTIFEYIRLLRITYEVAKKIDPNCWVSTGRIKYHQFLDAIMRYTDNPDEGKITDEYPAYGGAYFDCISNYLYPEEDIVDIVSGEDYNKNGSDILAKKIAILKNNHYNIAKKYGFDGKKYPEKIFLNLETGLNSKESNYTIGGDLVRRNWLIKVAFYSLEFNIKQIHIPYIADNNGGFGDYDKLGKFISLEEGSKYLKNSSKGRKILKKINFGKFIYDEEKTNIFRKSLPDFMRGIAFTRNFPKEKNEEYYYDSLYSVWLYSENEEISDEKEIKIDTPFDPLSIDFEGNEKKIKKNSKLKITSTPIFLLGNYKKSKDSSKKKSGFVIFLEIIGILIIIAILVGIGLYIYKRYLFKKSLIMDDKNLNEGLTDNN